MARRKGEGEDARRASTSITVVLVLVWRTTGWESASEIYCAMSCCSWISSSTSCTWSALLHAEHSTSTRSVHSLHMHHSHMHTKHRLIRGTRTCAQEMRELRVQAKSARRDKSAECLSKTLRLGLVLHYEYAGGWIWIGIEGGAGPILRLSKEDVVHSSTQG